MDRDIQKALLDSDGDVEAAAALLLQTHKLFAGPRLPKFLEDWLFPKKIPEEKKKNRYRFTPDNLIEDVRLTPHKIVLPTIDAPKYRVKVAKKRGKWPDESMEWYMVVRTFERVVFVLTKDDITPRRLTEIVKEIQSGINDGDPDYTAAFNAKHVTIPTRIDGNPKIKTAFQLRRDLALEIGQELFMQEDVIRKPEMDYARRIGGTFKLGYLDINILMKHKEEDDDPSPRRAAEILREASLTNNDDESDFLSAYHSVVEPAKEGDPRSFPLRDLYNVERLYAPASDRDKVIELGNYATKLNLSSYVKRPPWHGDEEIEFFGETLIVAPHEREFVDDVISLIKKLRGSDAYRHFKVRTMNWKLPAYTSTSDDKIVMPDIVFFSSAPAYLLTFLHEIGHIFFVQDFKNLEKVNNRYKLSSPEEELVDLKALLESPMFEEVTVQLISNLLLAEVGHQGYKGATRHTHGFLFQMIRNQPPEIREILVKEGARLAAIIVGKISPREFKRGEVIYP